MTVLIANPTKSLYNKHCAWCTYEYIKNQVQGIAKIYIRAHKDNPSHKLAGKWVIHVVRKGIGLKRTVEDGGWSVDVDQHPFKEKIDKHEQTRS